MAAIGAHHERYWYNGEHPLVATMIDGAIADVDEGVRFWKMISRDHQSDRELSLEFLNRGGGVFAESSAQL